MIAAAIPYILQGASLLGGVIGKKRKAIDPEYLRQHFGPRAVAQNAQELSNYILNSPYGQQLMASAAEQGQGLQTEMAARAAQSGLSPDTGGQSAASDFATSAASQAQAGFERQTRAGITQSAMPIAADMTANLQNAYIQDLEEQNAQPSIWQRIGAAAGQAASMFPGGGGGSGDAASAAAPTAAAIRPAGSAFTIQKFQPAGATPQFSLPQTPAQQGFAQQFGLSARRRSAMSPVQSMVQR